MMVDSRHISIAIGLGGVDPSENPRAHRWGVRFEGPMILLVIWLSLAWYLEAKGLYPPELALFGDHVVWIFFLVETAILSAVVDDRWRYLRQNWLNLVIILAGVPMLWGYENYAPVLRTARLLLIFPLLVNLSRTVRRFLAMNHLGTTLLVSALVIVLGGLVAAGIDDGFEDIWDGLWWAWVTVSTVGYGDIVPQTPAGRVFAAVLILFGVGLFSMLTANFSAFFIAKEEREEEEHLDQRLRRIEQRLEGMEHTLRRLEEHLEAEKGRSPHHGGVEGPGRRRP